MLSRKWNRVFVCLAALAAGTGGVLRAEEPANVPVTTLPAKAALNIDHSPFGKLFVTENTGGALNVVTATYGNALGVEIADIDPALRAQLGLDESTGVVVTNVNKESEAAKAGLARHDLVLKAGETTIGSPKQSHDFVPGRNGKTGDFQSLRKGKPATITITPPDTP